MGYLRPDGERVVACPDCEIAGHVYEREDFTKADGTAPYSCHRCGSTFSEPVEREPDDHANLDATGEATWQAHRRTVLGLDAGGE